MNKDDVLKRSRAENRYTDEREGKIRLRSYATSATIGGLLCMILYLIEGSIFDRSTLPIVIIYSGMMFSKSIIDAIKIKKPADVILSFVFGLVFVIEAVMYILGNVR